MVNEGTSARIVTDDVEKSEQFAEFFSGVYKIETDSTYTKLPNLMPVDSMPILSISEDMVMNKLNQLLTDKSPGPGMVHPRVLYKTRKVIVTYVTHLFNLSLQQSLIPTDWKSSIVIVLHKKGKKDCVANYRPI